MRIVASLGVQLSRDGDGRVSTWPSKGTLQGVDAHDGMVTPAQAHKPLDCKSLEAQSRSLKAETW